MRCVKVSGWVTSIEYLLLSCRPSIHVISVNIV